MKAVLLLALSCALGPLATGAEVGRYRIDGVEVLVEHATGTEAGRLIARQLARQPRDPAGNAAAWRSREGWRELASLDGRRSEVLQVRGSGGSLEAILSSVDLDQQKREPAASPVGWIPRTAVINHVGSAEDGSGQWLLRSAWSPARLRHFIQLASKLGGWRLDREDGAGLTFLRRKEQLRVLLLADGEGRGSIAVLTAWSRR